MAASVSVSFIGGGAMAQAIAGGILDSRTLESGYIHASAASNRFESWWTSRGMSFTTDNAECLNKSQVIVLAVKPHLYTEVFRSFADKGIKAKDKLWVSIMAGVTLADLQAAICSISGAGLEDRVVRTIPNTPCKVREGSVAVTYNTNCTTEDKNIVTKIFSGVARVNEIPERLQNAFAAMAGSGPAYIYQVIEAMADGGVMMGLPRALAIEHAAATVRGAATMVMEGDKHSAQLKDEVCSPGGSTIRGVQKLEEGGVRIAFINAIQAACNRNQELGKK
jgi:pyrroline-5-carboxylate reductase